MLSDLAGEEIEKLLSDGEQLLTGPGGPPLRAGDSSGAELDNDTVDALLRDAAAVLDTETTAALDASPPTNAATPAALTESSKTESASGSNDALANELDALFAELHKADEEINKLTVPAAPTEPTVAPTQTVAETEPPSEPTDRVDAEEPADLTAVATEDASEGDGLTSESNTVERTTPSPVSSPVMVRTQAPNAIAKRSKHTAHRGPPFIAAAASWAGPVDEQVNILDDLPEIVRDRWGWLLFPLVLLNKPFEAVSKEVRDVVGKVAILTLVNSALVIGYVMWFKR